MGIRSLLRLICLCGGLLAAVATAGWGACPPEPPEGTSAFWIQLPRADIVLDYAGWPVAPPPTPRAVERRERRGDPRRRARLERGPDPGALDAAAKLATRVRTVSRWLSSVSADLTPAQYQRVRARFGAAAVRPVARFVRADPSAPAPWAPRAPKSPSGPLDYGPSAQQIAQIQADLLHAQGFSGNGVRVLVLDTGFDAAHAALDHLEVVAERDFVFLDDVTVNEACDHPSQHNHGTGVLGVMAGLAPGDLIGPAYGVEVLLAKTEDVRSETQVEEDNFVAALEWGEVLGADVSTASLGYIAFDDGFLYPPEAFDGDTAVTTVALDDIAALGVVPVVAAGNRGPAAGSLLTPADADSAITVGSVDSLGVVSNFSSRGPTFDGRTKPDVVARGRLTTWAVASGGFGQNNGTSLAAPLVAGAAALLLEGHPEWNAMQVRDALRTTASQGTTPDNDRGWGVVQVADAMLAAPLIYPQPFPLVEPTDGSTGVGTAVTFRWGAALDHQTPSLVDYTVHASSTPEFADTVGLWFAAGDTSITVDPLPPGPFSWRVLATDPDGHVRASCAWVFTPGEPTGSPPGPGRPWARLSDPRPNPFNPAVQLLLQADRVGEASLEIYDLAGRRVLRLWGGTLSAGDRMFTWDGTDATGRPVASGVYLLRTRLRAPGAEPLDLTRRLVLVR